MPVPLALAMLVADGIHQDPTTGKMTILGTFTEVYGAEFPLVVGQMAVYVALTDARGWVAVQIVLVDVDEEREARVLRETELEFADPLVVVEWAPRLEDISFPEAGEHRIQLWAGGELVCERRVVADMMETEE